MQENATPAKCFSRGDGSDAVPHSCFLHTKRPAPGAEAQPRCRSFYTVAPAGVEPTMGESKSPALPLGDGAPVRISIVEFLSFVKQKRFAVSVQSVLPHFYHVFTVSLS